MTVVPLLPVVRPPRPPLRTDTRHAPLVRWRFVATPRGGRGGSV